MFCRLAEGRRPPGRNVGSNLTKTTNIRDGFIEASIEDFCKIRGSAKEDQLEYFFSLGSKETFAADRT